MKNIFGLAAGVLLALGFLCAEQAVPANQSPLKIEVRVGSGIENRKVTGENTTFPADTPELIGWTYIKGATEPTDITHVWVRNGNVSSTALLQIKSSSFRTWSRKKLLGQEGKWTFEVRDMDGQILASKSFEVIAAPLH